MPVTVGAGMDENRNPDSTEILKQVESMVSQTKSPYGDVVAGEEKEQAGVGQKRPAMVEDSRWTNARQSQRR
jgi:hypothetical protein